MNRRRPKPSIPEYKQTPGVIFQPQIHLRMQKGINQIVDAIRPTLGPMPRHVAVEKVPRTKSPELLDNGGLIARRIIDLKDPDENVGAMFIRGALWRLYEKVGDGTASAAVMFQTVYNLGLRYIAAGGNAMLLRGYLEEGLKVILETLDGMVIPVSTPGNASGDMLKRVALSVCYDDELANILSEIFNLIGEYGVLQIQSGRGRAIEKEFVEGSYWSGGLHSKEMMRDLQKQRTQFANAAILLTDLEIDEPDQIVPVLRAAVQAEIQNLFIMASKLSDKVMGVLSVNQKAGKLQVVAVKTPGMRTDDQMMALEDLSILTGGKSFLRAAGDTLETVTPKSFGYARKIWADMNYTGLVGGKNDPVLRRNHIEQLSHAYHLADEAEIRTKLRDRVGRLYSGAAVLWMGGMTESEITLRKELAQRTSDTMRSAIYGGVVTGGGVAFLACQPALRKKLEATADPDAQAAYRILLNTLETPFRTILANAGYSSGAILSRLEQAGQGYVFDVQSGQVVDAAQSGIFDVAAVQKEAAFSAIQSAAMALTIDAVVHRKKLRVATDPD
jgi:chaperonin GroEL